MTPETNRANLQVDNRQYWLFKLLPFLVWLRRYRRDDLPGDLVAGLTVATMLIPQSMAYALLAGVPPIVGLYTGIFPVLVYGLMGSTRMLTFGPTAITSVMILGSISGVAEPETAGFIKLSLTLALALGGVYLLMGLLRLGFIVNLLGQAVLEGYVNAAALIIVISQVKTLFGIDVPRSSYPAQTLLDTILNIGETHLPTLLLGGLCIVVVLLFSYRLDGLLARFRLNQTLRLALVRSGAMAAVLCGTVIVALLELNNEGISIIGDIPAGFPPIALGPYDFSEWQAILTGAVAIAFVGFMEDISTAKSLMRERKEKVDANQELIAMGAGNIASALTGGMAATTSISRSAVNYAAGANTGLSSIIAACVVGLTVSFFTPVFFYLPNTALAAIILTSVVKLFNVQSIRRLYTYSRLDTLPFFVTFLATFFINIPIGIASGIVVSLMAYLFRTSRPEIEHLGRIGYTEHYRDLSQNEDAHPIPGVRIIRIDESLYFANAQFLDRYLRNAIAESLDTEHLILVGDAMNWLDASALQILEDLIHDFERVGVHLYLTQLNPKVWGRLIVSGFVQRVGTHHFYQHTHEAVQATGMLLDDELPI